MTATLISVAVDVTECRHRQAELSAEAVELLTLLLTHPPTIDDLRLGRRRNTLNKYQSARNGTRNTPL